VRPSSVRRIPAAAANLRWGWRCLGGWEEEKEREEGEDAAGTFRRRSTPDYRQSRTTRSSLLINRTFVHPSRQQQQHLCTDWCVLLLRSIRNCFAAQSPRPTQPSLAVSSCASFGRHDITTQHGYTTSGQLHLRDTAPFTRIYRLPTSHRCYLVNALYILRSNVLAVGFTPRIHQTCSYTKLLSATHLHVGPTAYMHSCGDRRIYNEKLP